MLPYLVKKARHSLEKRKDAYEDAKDRRQRAGARRDEALRRLQVEEAARLVVLFAEDPIDWTLMHPIAGDSLEKWECKSEKPPTLTATSGKDDGNIDWSELVSVACILYGFRRSHNCI